MSKIVIYGSEQIRQLAEKVSKSYEKNLTQMLTFEDWKCSAFPVLYNQPEKFGVNLVDYSKPIRICPPVSEMLAEIKKRNAEITDIQRHARDEEKSYKITQLLKQIIKPAMVIDRPAGITIGGMSKKGSVEVPIWFNSTLKGVNLRMGFANMDSATPGCIGLGDEVVHAMLGGATGAGKSVTLNSIIASGMLEYSPWELEFYLMDMKIVELRRYGSRVHAPGVKIVGATGSTVFIMSMFNYLTEEMDLRQKLFAECGVENLKTFRNTFDMVLPRVVLIVDEFIQLFENIKIAEQEGCSDAAEQKSLINSSISKLARLGRNAGLHMLLSSQNLSGALDEQVSGQFKAGATVYADAAVSNALIGNDAGVHIKGKGKGIYNLTRSAKDPAGNVNVRIPFIQSDLKAEEEAAGKQPYLQELLVTLRKKADELGWPDNLYLFNEEEDIPYDEFASDMLNGSKKEEHPNTGKEITDNIFREEITKILTMGRPVKYDPGAVATIELKMRRNHSIIVGATSIDDRVYMLKLILENLKDSPFTHYAVIGDQAISRLIGIETGLSRVKLLKQKSLPVEIYQKYRNRMQLISAWNKLEDSGVDGWDTGIILSTNMAGHGLKYSPDMAKAFDKRFITEEIDDTELRSELEKAGIDSFKMDKAIAACSSTRSVQRMLTKMTNNFTTKVTANSFERIFVWFLGIDEHEDLGGDTGKAYCDLIGGGPLVGIHSIITAEHWDKAGKFAEQCNFILERCKKSFFTSCNIQVKVNTTENSLQLLDQQTNSYEIIKKYKIQ